jgi:hypothetical protein
MVLPAAAQTATSTDNQTSIGAVTTTGTTAGGSSSEVGTGGTGSASEHGSAVAAVGVTHSSSGGGTDWVLCPPAGSTGLLPLFTGTDLSCAPD